jgi:UDP-N-acetylglucosamine 4,6-dehydratase/5-epimerase
MASRGSVIPLFVEQIKSGQPLTITDPNMTRFLMSLEEAVELVVFAFQNAHAGDIMVQKAPASTIETLAEAIKRVFHATNPVQVIGTRHGEKQSETLLTREEMLRAKDLGEYFRVPADNRDLNYDAFFTEGIEPLSRQEDYNSDNTRRLDIEGMASLLLKLNCVRHELVTWERERSINA